MRLLMLTLAIKMHMNPTENVPLPKMAGFHITVKPGRIENHLNSMSSYPVLADKQQQLEQQLQEQHSLLEQQLQEQQFPVCISLKIFQKGLKILLFLARKSSIKKI